MGNVRRISKKYYLRQIVACMLVYFMFVGIPAQVALADIGTGGWDVVQGTADITAPGGGIGEDALIDVTSPNARAVINWQDFDTDVGQLAEFVRTAGGNFAVLNRVIGEGGLTEFNGNLKALMGDVFVVNTRGIIFGPESFIQARTFVASGIDISDRDFMVPDGEFLFERDSSGYDFDDLIGDVTNEGIGENHGIYAKEIALIGQNVRNKGSIVASGRDNIVVMAAGESVMLSRDGSNVSVEVSQGYTYPYEHVVNNGGDGSGGPGTGPGTIDATDGKVILAAGDIYSTAIEGIESLRAEATGDITLNGAVTADGHVEILGGQNRIISRHAQININEDITAGSMRIKNGKDVEPGEESLSGIYVAAGKNLEATDGDVVVEAVHNVELGGDVTATGDVFINGDEDGWGDPKGNPEDYNPRPYGGGDVVANNITAGGNVDIKGNAIQLNGDVTANGGDLTITGRTSKDNYTDFSETGLDVEWGYIDVAENKVLQASGNVVLTDAFGSGGDEEPPAGEMDLFGDSWLAIRAEGGSIQTQGPFGEGVKITVENPTSASLHMRQADPLNLADYSFGNQNKTALYLNSINGSITAVDSSQPLSGKNENAADQWTSITAHARTDITLQGHDASRDITAGTLISYASGFDTGNITVTSDNSQVLLTENVRANQGSVAVTAIDGGIVSSGHITASDGITLFGEVTADASVDQTFDAGNGTLWAKDTLSTITKGTGGLTLSGDTLVDLDGIDGSTGDSVWVKDGFLTITDSVDVEGNLKAKGVIHLQGATNNVAGDILSTGSGIIIDHDLDADGVGSQTFDAGTGSLIAENEADIDKSTAGSLTLAGDAGIELGGNVTGSGMESGDELTFENNVTADGTGAAQDQRFDAGLGALDADYSITKTTDGKLNLGGDEGIELGGNVETHDGDLTFEAAVTANGGDQSFDAGTAWHSWGNDLVAADDIIKTTDGSLTLDGGRGDTDSEIYLAGNVETHDGDLIFKDKVVANGIGDQSLDAGTAWHSWGNDLVAEQDITKTTAGSLTLDGGRDDVDSEIYLAGNVKTTDGDLTFEDKVIANGSDSQRLDAVGGKLWAQQTITKTTAGSGDLNLGGDDAIDLDGTVDVQTTSGSLTIEDDFTAAGDLLANENVTIGPGDTWVSGTLDGPTLQKIQARNGYLRINSNPWLSPWPDLKKTTTGDLQMLSGQEISAKSHVTVQEGKLDMTANDGINIWGNLESSGDMTLTANNDAKAPGNILGVSGSIKSTGGTVALTANGYGVYLYTGPTGGRNVEADKDIMLNDNTHVTYNVSSGENQFDAGGDVYLKYSKDLTGNYALNVKAGDDIILGAYDKDYPSGGGSAGDVTANGNLKLDAGDDIYAYGDLISNDGSIDIYSSDDTTYLGGDVYAAYDVTLHNNTILDGEGYQEIVAGIVGDGTMTAGGWVWKTTPGNLYLDGYNSDPEHNNGKAIDLQYAGCLPAASTCEGNLELYAPDGDIQISGDLTTFWGCYYGNDDGPRMTTSEFNGYFGGPGGVSIIAENGKIYTDGASPENDTLNIGITGNSDDISHRMDLDNGYEYIQGGMPQLGVDLPYGDGKAAIVVLSSEDLKFGPDTMLIARGIYNDSVVDDRPGVGFLADPLTAIGGIIRDEGDPIDVAVYVGSMGTDDGQGNVHLDGRAIDVAQNGTMVVDAYDTVSFGDFDTFNLENLEGCKDLSCFFIKLALRFPEENLCEAFGEYVELNGWYEGVLEDFLNDTYDEDFFFNIDRLEVVSRITEWLFEADAFGTLPYPYNPEIVEAFIGGEYVLRGAGLGNPDIFDGRAWVLEDPLDPAPLYEEAGEAAEEQEFAEGGCPPLMNWLSNEIGVPAEDIQVVVADALALNTDIQPCEMCARLMQASKLLQDVDGTRIAAMAQVVNEFVTTPAPPSEEQMTLIAAALAEHIDDGTHYAAAGQWIDALVAYIGIMNTEMGYSASDAAAFAQKYLTPVTETGNVALIAYVQARLAALGG